MKTLWNAITEDGTRYYFNAPSVALRGDVQEGLDTFRERFPNVDPDTLIICAPIFWGPLAA